MASVTILLVEDNADNRAIYRTILEHSGYAVVEAVDGQSGLHAARELRPDVMLLDVSLPVMDGWQVAQRLKADAETAGIPIIALTARAMTTDRQKAAEVGCDAYLPKPVEPRRVLEEVERFLAAAVSRASPDERGAADAGAPQPDERG